MFSVNETKVVKISTRYGTTQKLVVKATGQVLLHVISAESTRNELYRQWGASNGKGY